MARWWMFLVPGLFVALLLASDPVAAHPETDATAGVDPSATPTSSAAAAATDSASVPVPSAAPAASASAAPRATPPRDATAPLLDQSTPRQSVAGFLRAIEAQRLGEAARYLDLRGLRWAEQTPPEAAGELGEVLRRRVWIDLSSISDRPEGLADDGADVERVAMVEVDDRQVPITLVRTERGEGQVWLFSATTVAQIPELAGVLGAAGWVSALVPASFQQARWMGLWSWQWLGILLAMVIGFPAGYGFGTLSSRMLHALAQRTAARWDNAVVSGTRGTLRLALGWLAMGLVLLSLDLPSKVVAVVRFIVATPLVLLTGWLLIMSIRAVSEVYLDELVDDQEMQSRGLRTQLVILRKVATVSVVLITLAVVLMQFDVVRTVGLSLLASAGVAGVALGFAAQKSLGAVVAGLQLSVTQPIRLGDSIVVQNEWGTVEEITLTYVRVKLWDERRLIVPTDKFLAEIFENWSKPGDAMIGVVMLAVDPTAPVQVIREELERAAAAHPAHDGRECRLQLFDVDERRALLRARVSTSDVAEVLNLRCDLREHMVGFLQQLDGGRYLPRQRWQQVSPAISAPAD